MAKARASALKAIDKFVNGARQKIDVTKVVFFGSHVAGRSHKWSDIDIAVVSEDFQGVPMRDRLMILNKIAWEQGVTQVDALGYTGSEFDSEDPLDLVTEIKKSGLVVYEKPQT